jgi:MFS family permease
MSERDPQQVSDDPNLAPPARFTRETLMGCLGIACVLLLLPLLWLGLGATTGWVARALPLVAFALVVLGAALTLRVPGGLTQRSRDPRRPLTRAGIPPVIERPATLASRASFALAAGLIVLAGAGYLVESGANGPHAPWGLFVSLASGAGLLAHGALVGMGRFTAPALRWQRISIIGGAHGQGGALAAIGFVTLGGSLLLALLEGFSWGVVGLTLLVTALVVAAPLARRAPRQERLSERRWIDPEDTE